MPQIFSINAVRSVAGDEEFQMNEMRIALPTYSRKN